MIPSRPYIFAITLEYCTRQAIGDQQETLGFTVEGRRSRRTPTVVISDLDFADAIALNSDEIAQAHERVLKVEKEAAEIGLHLNETKTEYMVFNHSAEEDGRKFRSGAPLTKVNELKYLGSWLLSDITCAKDVKARKVQAWIACHKLRGIWTSKLPRSKRIRVFRALV